MDVEKKTKQLRKIKDEVVALESSPLYAYRVENGNHPVIGEGNHDADIMFVGEAPGKNEAATGRPFCGRAGKILDSLLAHIGLPREEVYITNILKDRPPQNRDPSTEEIAAYAPFLNQQIDIIQPEVIATLGRFAMQYILQDFFAIPEAEGKTISRIRGTVFTARADFGEVAVVPLFHPAVATYSPSKIDELKKDIETLTQFIA